jgi:uncharacterized protein YndB with AHSA1/START domain
MMDIQKSEISDRELVFTKILNAPCELVFDAWTNPNHVEKWWGPTGFTTTTKEMQVKPGGVWRFTMHGPDGRDYPNKIEFLEVVRPEKLTYRHSDDDATLEPVNFHVTVLFKALTPNQTELTMRSVFPSAEDLQRVAREYGAIEGAHQHLARLKEYITAMPIVIERTLRAPAVVVWQALTDNAQMKHWYFELDAFKPDPGFEFQFYGEGLKGEKYLHRCTVTEVVPFQKLRYSWRYEGYEGNSFVTFELVEKGNETHLRLTHEGLETFPPIPDFAKENFMQGWTELISKNLKTFVEKE